MEDRELVTSTLPFAVEVAARLAKRCGLMTTAHFLDLALLTVRNEQRKEQAKRHDPYQR